MLVTSVMSHIKPLFIHRSVDVSYMDLSRRMNKKYNKIQYNSDTGIVINSENCPTILRGIHLFLSWHCVCAGVGGSF